MKFLILGCNGMAGHMISLYLFEQGHEVFGFDRAKSPWIPSVAGDACDPSTVQNLLTEGRFDTAINCIGLLNQEAERKKALASYLNGCFPHFLAEVTDKMDTQVIHMSTDCVFSGKRGGYTELDLRDGETFYDRSKALGELEDEKNLTLRNSIVGPDPNSKGIGLLNWFLQQKIGVNGFTKVLWTGQTTLQLAKTMEAAARERAAGLVNAVPDRPISKYDLLCLFNHYFRGDSLQIHPAGDMTSDKSLVRTNVHFSYRIPDYETMVAELAEWTRKHRRIYPHYQLA